MMDRLPLSRTGRPWLAMAAAAWMLAACGGSGGADPIALDSDTAQQVADVLRMDHFDSAALPPGIAEKLRDAKNGPRQMKARYEQRLAGLIAQPDVLSPDASPWYATLQSTLDEPNTRQLYAMNNLLAKNSNHGYQPLPGAKAFSFPLDDRIQAEYQVGWHFYVGSVVATTGEEFGVQVMYWYVPLLPPDEAAAAGLSPQENLVVETHLAISEAGRQHHRISPQLVAGTTGLVHYQDAPVALEVGRNFMRARSKDAFFPLDISAYGVDRSGSQGVALQADLTLLQTKPYVLNGDQGLAPSCDGTGTLYYSVPALALGEGSSLRIGGKTYPLASGKLWYDHQWGTGFMPGGNVNTPGFRAVVNLAQDNQVGGWDWMFGAFDDGTEIALSALHTVDGLPWLNQSGPTPPAGVFTQKAIGSYIDAQGHTVRAVGRMQVSEWVKGGVSHGPYQAPGVWYPNRFDITLDAAPGLPEDKRTWSLVPIVSGGQQGFFAAGPHYSEGAAYVEQAGQRTGRGFMESTGYVDATRQSLALSHVAATPAHLAQLSASTEVTDAIKAESIAYLAEHGQPTGVVCRGIDAY